eukprot:gene3240-3517_t
MAVEAPGPLRYILGVFVIVIGVRTITVAHRLYTTTELQVQVEPLSQPNEGISVVNLSRPEAKNAIGRQLLRELQEAINTLRQERTTRCVIVRSTCPGTFCAGADLKERATMTQAEAAEFVSSLRRTFTDLSALPMPSIAVLEGAAFGGGAELALACDLRIGDPQALLAFPETRLGIMPGAGGTQRLPRLVGLGAAKELIFTAKRVGAPEAVRLGLLDHCVDQGKAMERALELARDIAQCAPLSLRAAKAAINQGIEVDLGSGLKLEEALYAQLLPTRDRIEGLKAFAEKRQPLYTGE